MLFVGFIEQTGIKIHRINEKRFYIEQIQREFLSDLFFAILDLLYFHLKFLHIKLAVVIFSNVLQSAAKEKKTSH